MVVYKSLHYMTIAPLTLIIVQPAGVMATL